MQQFVDVAFCLVKLRVLCLPNIDRPLLQIRVKRFAHAFCYIAGKGPAVDDPIDVPASDTMALIVDHLSQVFWDHP